MSSLERVSLKPIVSILFYIGNTYCKNENDLAEDQIDRTEFHLIDQKEDIHVLQNRQPKETPENIYFHTNLIKTKIKSLPGALTANFWRFDPVALWPLLPVSGYSQIKTKRIGDKVMAQKSVLWPHGIE